MNDYYRNFSVRDYVIGSVAGAVAAGIITLMMSLHSGPELESARLYRQENRPAVMCVEKNKRHQLLVEKGDNDYVLLEDYLNDLPEKPDSREQEKKRIEDMVGWDKKSKRCGR